MTEQKDNLNRDLAWLSKVHGISEPLLVSLVASPEEAKAHIRFFKRMMRFVNGGFLFVGFCVLGWGIKRLFVDVSGVSVGVILMGAFLCLYMGGVLRRQVRAISAVETIARKHGLLDD